MMQPHGHLQESEADDHRHLTSRCRTQPFALECLHDICTIVASSGQIEHFNSIVGRMGRIPSLKLLTTAFEPSIS